MITHSVVDTLPNGAWIVSCSGGVRRIVSGAGLRQISPHVYFEGAVGNTSNPEQAAEVFGTGVQERGADTMLLTTSHSLEMLFFVRNSAGHWHASNSLALLAAQADLSLDWDKQYTGRLATAVKGIEEYSTQIGHADGWEISRFMVRNVVVSPQGHVTFEDKPVAPAFKSFDQYQTYLKDTLRSAFDFAQRHGGYTPAATCSTGYDSACASALAASVGCKEAITLRNARGGDSDSGREIATALGLDVTEFDRPQEGAVEWESMVPFVASGMGGEDYCYQAFGPAIAGKVVVTGFHGDKMWDAGVHPNAVLSRGDISGSSLQEFRLWTNSIFIPVPMIGALQHAAIAAITEAAEMAPWRLNNDYDRPIARRIVETAGVRREAFGQRKRAASMLVFSDARIGAQQRQAATNELPYDWRQGAEKRGARSIWAAKDFLYRVARKLKVEAAGEVIVGDWRVFEHTHPQAVADFGAAHFTLKRKYQGILAGTVKLVA
jgi:hypothetical protein